MFIWGLKDKIIAKKSSGEACSSCKKTGAVFYYKLQQWFHVFWIPLFPFGRLIGKRCEACKSDFKTIEDRSNPLYIKLSKRRAPLWTWSGLLLFIAIIITGLLGSHFEKVAIKNNIESLRSGELLQVHTGAGYSFWKIAAVKGDSVYYKKNKRAEQEIYPSESLPVSENDFIAEPFAATKNELKEGVDKDEILRVVQ